MRESAMRPYSISRTLALFIRDRYRSAGSGQSALREAIRKLALVVDPFHWTIAECVEFASVAGFPTHESRSWSVAMFRGAVRNIIERAG